MDHKYKEDSKEEIENKLSQLKANNFEETLTIVWQYTKDFQFFLECSRTHKPNPNIELSATATTKCWICDNVFEVVSNGGGRSSGSYKGTCFRCGVTFYNYEYDFWCS